MHWIRDRRELIGRLIGCIVVGQASIKKGLRCVRIEFPRATRIDSATAMWRRLGTCFLFFIKELGRAN